ncbi:MAG: DUF11 domain-containing protein, partial [Candidatus Solibacter usitatus]|nr:DUF11 domain-containing protein [Candidatus Solibacter usitatus]
MKAKIYSYTALVAAIVVAATGLPSRPVPQHDPVVRMHGTPLATLKLPTPASTPASAAVPLAAAVSPETRARVTNAVGKLPLHFEANTGQTDEQVKFLARSGGYTMFLTPTEAVLTVAARPNAETEDSRAPSSRRTPGSRTSMDSLDSHVRGNDELNEAASTEETKIEAAVLRLQWKDANPNPRIAGADPLPGKSAYFHGNDPAQWRTDVPHYSKVRYEAVYPGIDLVYYGNQRQIEYDFVVSPGADPDRIRLAIQGAEDIRLDAQGNLVLATAQGELLQKVPIVYQEIEGKRVPVEGRYVLHANHEVGFQVAAYDVERTLVIDPILQSTYLGGSADDQAFALTIHPTTGDVYVGGYTTSSDFPGVTGGADTTFAGADEGYVARLNAGLTTLIQATYLGGSNAIQIVNVDVVRSIAIHPLTGDVYIAGYTNTVDFPGTTGGAQPAATDSVGAFVARLNAGLTTLTQATHLTGSRTDYATALAIHPISGDVYVAGLTESNDFPGIAGGADTTFGGTQEAFVARLNNSLTSLTQATLLGGSNSAEQATALAIHPVTGDIYVSGETNSSDFPGILGGADATFGGTQEAFVVRLNSALTSLTQATFLGGSASLDRAFALAIHPVTGDVYVAGETDSSDFPGIAGGADTSFVLREAFVARLNSTLTTLTQATFLGGSAFDSAYALAIHPVSGDVYVAGSTQSTNFPGIAGGADTTFVGTQEGYVTRLNSALTSLTQATYLGGSNLDPAFALAIHPVSGEVYAAGATVSNDFPGIAGGAQTAFGGIQDAFITRITPDLLACLTAITVTNTADTVDATPGNGFCADSTGTCTLRAAIMEANACPANPVISVPAGTYTFTLAGTGEDAAATGDLDINTSLTIQGAGAATTIINANGIDRVFDLDPADNGVTITISGVTITGGNIGLGQRGGGIDTTGGTADVILNNVVVQGNNATFGGGIANAGNSMIITASTISGNTTITDGASTIGGGGIYNFRDLTIENSTISGNTADLTTFGGGIYIGTANVTIRNSTIAGNSALSGGNIYANNNATNFSLFNTIVANSAAGGNCAYEPPLLSAISLGNNLDSANTCGFASAGDLINTNPNLGPLANNGGPTFTHALLPGSPAIDAGNNTGCPATDQRGVARPVDGDAVAGAVCDIGAYEAAALGVADLVLTKTDAPDPLTVGATLTYTLTVTNNGPDPATGIVLTDTLPVGVTFGTVTPGGPTCTQAAGVVTCGLGTLANGASTVVTITVTPTAPGAITNSASATHPNEVDPNAANNTNIQATTTVNPVAVLFPNINVTPLPVAFGNTEVGSFSTRTVTVANNGAANLVLGTIVPPVVPYSRTGGSCVNGQTLVPATTCTIVLRFTPTVLGAAGGGLNVPSNDPDVGTANGQNNVLAALTGVGIAPPVVDPDPPAPPPPPPPPAPPPPPPGPGPGPGPDPGPGGGAPPDLSNPPLWPFTVAGASGEALVADATGVVVAGYASNGANSDLL